MGWYPEGVREGGLHCNWFITLQNPKIKRKIFICCPCTFSIQVEGKSSQKYWLNSYYVIMFFYIYIFFFSDHCVSVCTETKKNLTLGTLTDWTVKTLQKLYLHANEPMKVNMMKVNVPPHPPQKKKKKQTTTTKLFLKPLKKEGAKSNKKNCKLLGKKPNQWPQKKKKRHQCTLTPCSLKNSSTRNWCNSSCLKWLLFGSYSQRAKNHLMH